MSGNVSVFDFAKYILKMQDHGSLTTMKLQKLVYYSQVWCCVFDKQTFSDKIEAWVDGPVVRILWEKTKGKYVVSFNDIEGDINVLEKGTKKTIERVLKVYGKKTGEQLSELTHAEDPWQNAWKNGKNTEIGLGELKSFYSSN